MRVRFKKVAAMLLTLLMVLGGFPGLLVPGGGKAFAAQTVQVWQNVGSAGFSSGQALNTSLYVYNGTPYVAYLDSDNSNKATLKKYDGSSWVNLGVLSDGTANYTSLYVFNGIPYVAYSNMANNGKATVKKYDGSNWVTVGSADFSAWSASYVSLYVDKDGTPYVAYQDSMNGGKATVMKYDGTGSTGWVAVGGAPASDSRADYTSLYVVNGTPYVAYSDAANSGKATVRMYNNGLWQNVGSIGFSADQADYISLYVDSGIPYVAYSDWGNGRKGMVKKYTDASGWETVGIDSFSASVADYTSLYINNGTPYVAYSDPGNYGKAAVMKFEGGQWLTVGNAGFSTSDTSYTSLYVYNGTPYTAYRDNGISGKMTVMSLNTLSASPGLTADTTDTDQTHDIEITFADDAVWRAAITEVYDNTTSLPLTAGKDYTIDAGKLTIKAGVLAEEGNHEIMIKAAGYADASVIQAMTAVVFSQTGSANDPYLITDAIQLFSVRSHADKNFKLMADIDLSRYKAGKGWNPIGDVYTPFTGTLNGNGHKITGLTINRPSNDYVGLFGYLYNASITNIGLENVTVIGNQNVGGLVGIGGLTISNSYVTGSVTGGTFTGGLIGWNNQGTISNSYASVNVTGNITSIGGLVGGNYGTISNSYATGNVTASDYDTSVAGGLAGYNQGSISSSLATGNVKGNTVGGLLGGNNQGTITNSYATGNVTGSGNSVGGLVGGSTNGTISNSYATGNVTGSGNTGMVGGLIGNNYTTTISKSYAIGKVTGNSQYVGGLVGLNRGNIDSSSFYDNVTTGRSDSGKGVGKTTAEMKTQSTYTGWDFTKIWGIDSLRNNGYPYLRDIQKFVIYDGNGNTGGVSPTDSKSYPPGRTVTVAGNTGNLANTGYALAGWNTAKDGTGTDYAGGATFSMGTSDVTLYAKWIPAYSVTYNGNGSTSGSAPTDSNVYVHGAKVAVNGNTGSLARTGYTFAGWNTAADGTGTDYAEGATFSMGTSDMTLYAKWIPIYTVTYNGNGATSGSVPVDSGSYKQGVTVSVYGNTGSLAKSGYTFAGWNTAADGSGTTDYTEGATFSIGISDVTLYAKWIPIYTVTYNGNGATSGSVPVDGGSYKQGVTVSVYGNTGNLVKTGYTFAGWNTAADGTGTNYSAGAAFSMSSSSVTLYSKWIPIFTVTYNGNGATSGSVPIDSGSYEQSVTVSVYGNTGNFAKTGYTFAGWNTKADGTGTDYAEGATFSMGTSDVTLYAKWTAVAAPGHSMLTAQSGDGQVTLNWDSVSGTVTYSVYQGTTSGVYDSLPVATVTGSTYNYTVTGSTYSYTVTGSTYNYTVTGSTYNYTVTGLTNGTTYYFIVKAYNAEGIGSSSSEAVATPHSNAYLNNLTLSGATLPFDYGIFTYQASVANSVSSITVTPTAAESNATVTVNGTTVTSGQASGTIALNVGSNKITIVVTSQDGKTANTYTLTINRAELKTAGSTSPIQVTTEPVSITVPSGVTNAAIAVTTTTAGSNKEATLPLVDVQAETSLGTVSVTIPQGTKITAPANWDGTIKLPEVQSSSSVTVPGGNVSTVIEVGSTDVTLTFDKAVRLLIPNQGGTKVGFVRNGVFTEITGTLFADTQAAADSEIAAGGDAKITVGNDMAVWTKHFTKFVSYKPVISTRADNTSTGSGSGAAVTNYTTITAASGGTATLNGVTVEVPAGAMASDIQVTVDKVSDASILPVDSALQLVSDVYEIKKDKDGDFSKPVVITLPFDKTKVDFSKSTAGVYWLNEQIRKWVPLDDLKVNEANGTVSGSVNHFTKFAVLASDKARTAQPQTKEVDFADMKGHWAEANVRELVKLGAINGYPDNSFKPNANITRAEFVTVIVKAFHLEAQAGKTFADTENHWAKSAIATASAAGIVAGYSDNSFGPDDLITREQMAAIVVRAAKLAQAADKSVSFPDSADISGWARTALVTAAAKGLINGYGDGTVKPKAHATRAEAVTVILRALQLKP